MKSGAGQASLGLSDLRAQSFPKKNIPRRAGPGLRDHRVGTRTQKKIKKNTKNSQVPQLRFESSKSTPIWMCSPFCKRTLIKPQFSFRRRVRSVSRPSIIRAIQFEKIYAWIFITVPLFSKTVPSIGEIYLALALA